MEMDRTLWWLFAEFIDDPEGIDFEKKTHSTKRYVKKFKHMLQVLYRLKLVEKLDKEDNTGLWVATPQLRDFLKNVNR